GGKSHGLTRGYVVDGGNFEQLSVVLYHGHPVFGAAFTGTHARLGRFLGDGLIREDFDPHLAAALDITRHGDTGGLDLVRGDPGGLQGNDAILALRNGIATHGLTFHAAALDAAVFHAFGQ